MSALPQFRVGTAVTVGKSKTVVTVVCVEKQTDAAGDPYWMVTLRTAGGKESQVESSRLTVAKRAGR